MDELVTCIDICLENSPDFSESEYRKIGQSIVTVDSRNEESMNEGNEEVVIDIQSEVYSRSNRRRSTRRQAVNNRNEDIEQNINTTRSQASKASKRNSKGPKRGSKGSKRGSGGGSSI